MAGKNKRNSLIYALRKEQNLNTGELGRGGSTPVGINSKLKDENSENEDNERKIINQFRLN